jgi:integrase
MGPDGIILPPPALYEHLGFKERGEDFPFRISSLSFPLKDSIYPFSHGLPGSMKTVRNIKLCLSSIMGSAEEDELIPANPAVGPGKKMRKLLAKDSCKSVGFLTRAESSKFLDTVWQFFPWFYALFLTALRTGMRLGELLGLQPGDIHFDEGYIYVERTVVRGRIKPCLKNGKPRRVDMSQQLPATLKLLLEQRKRDSKDNGWLKPPVWLFYNKEGGFLDPANLRERIFKKVLEKAEMRPIRLHDLRHTFASQLVANKESLVYVKEQMGHSSIQVTVDLYGHLVPGSNRQAVDRLDDERVVMLSATKVQPDRF